MFNKKLLYLTLFSIVFVCNSYSMNIEKPLGFGFGSSKDDVKEVVEASDKIIINDEEQTKDIDRLIVDGAFVDIPVKNSNHYESRFDFFKNDLMSSSLHFSFDDVTSLSDAKDIYLGILTESFGEPASIEKMLSYKLTMWKVSDTKVLLSSNDSNKTLKVEFLSEPIMAKKIEKEIDKKLYGEFADPAERTFKDGDYSRPTVGRGSRPDSRLGGGTNPGGGLGSGL